MGMKEFMVDFTAPAVDLLRFKARKWRARMGNVCATMLPCEEKTWKCRACRIRPERAAARTRHVAVVWLLACFEGLYSRWKPHVGAGSAVGSVTEDSLALTIPPIAVQLFTLSSSCRVLVFERSCNCNFRCSGALRTSAIKDISRSCCRDG